MEPELNSSVEQDKMGRIGQLGEIEFQTIYFFRISFVVRTESGTDSGLFKADNSSKQKNIRSQSSVERIVKVEQLIVP